MQNVGMIIYILFFALIADGIWIGLNRGKTGSLKSLLFFFSGLFFVVSAMKTYLGEAESTLPESFWDIESATYLHYGIILIVISVIAPCLMKWIFSRNAYKLMHVFDAAFVLLVSVDLFFVGRMANGTYCILYAICLIIGFGAAFWYQKPVVYISREDMGKKFVESLPFIGAWVVMTGIYLPNELFINNLEEFTGNYVAFFLIMLIGSIVETCLLIFMCMLFLPQKVFKIMYLLFAGMGCAGYIQSMFLNGPLDAMNGSGQTWSKQKILMNIGIWFVILLAVIFGGYCRDAVRKVCRLLCIYISLIQIVTLGWMMLTSDTDDHYENAAITNKGSLELAQEDNVLVFVLDNFDSSWFEEICQNDGSVLEPLADFTYYRNGTSQFAHTNTGIPYMLTGVEWNADEADYFEYAYGNSDVVENIAERGTDVRIFTDLPLMSEELYQAIDNYSDNVVRKYDILRTFFTMVKTSMYKTMPFLMKPLYEYYSSDINEMSYNRDLWSIDNDLLFYQNIVENGLCISESEKSAFRFFHMRGPHAPFYLTEDMRYESTGRISTLESQGKGSLKVVYEYMEQMKELGKYDDATIIITADHGQGNILGSKKYQGKPDKTSRTLFLIKKPYEHHDNVEISEAPVSQAELIPTILEALGMEYASYGRTFEEIPIDKKRIRKYIDIYGNYKVEYVIDGHAADLDSWSIEHAEFY